MSISAGVRPALRTLGSGLFKGDTPSWFDEYARTAPWQLLRSDFPHLWADYRRLPDPAPPEEVDRLLRAARTRQAFREDVLLLAARRGHSVPVDILGPRRSDAVRASIVAALAMGKRARPSVARAASNALRAYQWHELRAMFPAAAEGTAGASELFAAGSGAGSFGYEALTRTPQFDEFAGGLLVEMSRNAAAPAAATDLPGLDDSWVEATVNWIAGAVASVVEWLQGS
jgi:hypothetical protein